MPARVQQSAVIMLAVNLDEAIGNVAQYRGRYARAAGEGSAAAVGLERAADKQRLAWLGLDALLGEQLERGMIRRQLELGGDDGLGLALSHQSGVCPDPQRQSEAVQ